MDYLKDLLSTKHETNTKEVVSVLQSTTPEERRATYLKCAAQHPNKVLVIVQRDTNCTTVPLVDKQKFIVPPDLDFARFTFTIRSRLPTLPPEKALFYFVGKQKALVPPHTIMSELAKVYADEYDHFLVIYYRDESTFG